MSLSVNYTLDNFKCFTYNYLGCFNTCMLDSFMVKTEENCELWVGVT